MTIPIIISGGQTGVDRGALDGALNQGVPCGGYCPEDRQAEDGAIDVKYPLTPLAGAGYRRRTRQNVMDSDATVIIYHRQILPNSGTQLTLKTCIDKHKPYLLIDMNVFDVAVSADYVWCFIEQYDIKRLNFAGPRESVVAGIQQFTQDVVERLIHNKKGATTLISTTYHPKANALPMISLTIKDGKLLLLDWYNDKTAKLFDKLGKQAVFIPSDKLDNRDINQALALQVMHELDEYFLGKRQVFDVPLDLSHGTPFQQTVWHALCQIPYGQTISYKALAKRIGKPDAHRACANANGKNPISLIVPCHRVVASDGGLGGYTGGVAIKEVLLGVEGINIHT